jgi:hypothetical protein
MERMDGLKEEYDPNNLPCIGCICLPICKNIRNENKHLQFYVSLGLLKSRCETLNKYLGFTVSYTNNKRLTKVMNFYE